MESSAEHKLNSPIFWTSGWNLNPFFSTIYAVEVYINFDPAFKNLAITMSIETFIHATKAYQQS